MLSNYFKKNNFFQIISLTMISFLVGFLSFFGYLLYNFSLDVVILIISCYSPLYSLIILFGQLSSILFVYKMYIYLPEFLQIHCYFDNIVKILLFFIFKIFLYSLFFKKILEEFDFPKILKTFIYFGVLNVFLSFFCLIFLSVYKNISIFKGLFQMNIYNSIIIIGKIVLKIISDLNNATINSGKEIINISFIGVNSMIFNIHLFFTSLLSSFFLSLITKNPTEEIFQKFNSTVSYVTDKYKLICLLLFIVSIIFFILKLNLLFMISWCILISLFFIFFVIGRNLLFRSIESFFGNYLFSIVAMMLLYSFVPNLLAILTLVGFIVSIFGL
jgi:hypothetical protein